MKVWNSWNPTFFKSGCFVVFNWVSSYGYVGAHLSRFLQLLVIVSLASCNVQKIAVFDPELCRKSENWSPLSN